MKPSKPYIHHKRALNWIKKLESAKEATLKKSGIFESNFQLEIERKLELFEFELNYEHQFKLHGAIKLGYFENPLPLSIADLEIVAERVFLKKHSGLTYTGQIEEFFSKEFSEENHSFFRLFIPLQKEIMLGLSLEESFFASDLGFESRMGSHCFIFGEKFTITIIDDGSKDYYLTIDSKSKQDFENFSEKAFAVRNALAYITGYYAGDSCYFFSYGKEQMKQPISVKFTSIRSTMKSMYEPINTNPYSRLYYDRQLAEKWYNSNALRVLSIRQFSRLAELIYSNQDFASAIILILESSVASLLFMPGGYAIALETIAPIILKTKKLKLAPINKSGDWKYLLNELLEVVAHTEILEPKHNYEMLRKRINDLNKPTNKAKLRAPFDSLNITLLEEDLKILQSRDAFLHGRVPDLTETGEGHPVERVNADLYYSALRFYTLLSMPILKFVGYDNYVLNYPRINVPTTGIELEEEPYRKV